MSKYYYPNDAKLIGGILSDNWSNRLVDPDDSTKICKKPTFAYEPDTDNDSFDYSRGDILCNITYDQRTSIPRGIGYDGSTDSSIVTIRIRARSDDIVGIVTDEVDRILKNHAIYPSENWQLLECIMVQRIVPGRKFSQRYMTYKLVNPWKPRIKPTS